MILHCGGNADVFLKSQIEAQNEFFVKGENFINYQSKLGLHNNKKVLK